MTDKAISPLRRRLIEDMTIRRLSANTQHQYIRHVRSFADFVGRSADKATAEDVHHYQVHLGSIGTTIPTVNAGVGGESGVLLTLPAFSSASGPRRAPRQRGGVRASSNGEPLLPLRARDGRGC
jgi:hypothetical protein